MKKIGLIIFLVLSFLLLTNCNKDEKILEGNKPETTICENEKNINFKYIKKYFFKV